MKEFIENLDYEFPKRAKLKEILGLGNAIKLESIDVCHKSSYDALYGLRLNFTDGISTDLIKTQSYKKDSAKNYKIDQSKRVGKVGVRVDEAGEVYGIRLQEENGKNIISINWVDQGTWVDMVVPNGSSIIGFYCRTRKTDEEAASETKAKLAASTDSSSKQGDKKAGSSPTKLKQTDNQELKTIQDLGFTLWKWS